MGGFRKLNRSTASKIQMLRNMVTSLIEHERIRTTYPKAMELRTWAERLVGYAKKGDLHNRRLAARIVRTPEMVKKLFDVIGPRYL